MNRILNPVPNSIPLILEFCYPNRTVCIAIRVYTSMQEAYENMVSLMSHSQAGSAFEGFLVTQAGLNGHSLDVTKRSVIISMRHVENVIISRPEDVLSKEDAARLYSSGIEQLG